MNIEKLQKLQLIYTRLLFDKELYEYYLTDADNFVRDLNLSKNDLKLITLNHTNHLAEIYSRRGMIAREIGLRAPNLLKALYPDVEKPYELFQRSSILIDFLKSESFIKPKWCMPSPEYMGYGYENYTKFFVFTLYREETVLPSNLVKPLKIDLGIFLITQSKHSNNQYYQKFLKGLYWCDDKWLYFIDKDAMYYEMKRDDIESVFDNSGVISIDHIKNDLLTTQEN